MSWYTYFYPTIEKYNPRALTDTEVTKGINNCNEHIDEDILGIKTSMIDAYYDKGNTINVRSYFHSLRYWLEELNKFDNIQWIEGELKEYGCVAINHANCNSEYELQLFIDNHKEAIDNCLKDLIVLSRIRFNKDDYDDANESHYLRYGYQEEIDSIIDNLKEIECSLSRDQFMLDNFDTKKNEGELAREEQEKDSTSKEGSE